MNSFSDMAIDLDCPQCSARFTRKLSELTPGKSYRCRRCGTDIRFQGDGASKVRKSLGDFEKSLKNIQIKL